MQKKLHRSDREIISRSRTYCFTSFLKEEPEFNDLQMSYLVFGRETCPTTQRLHWQGFIRFHNAKSFKAVCKLLPHMHIKTCLGTAGENIAYCTKDENFKEFGERPHQGSRSDLESIATDISNGMSVDLITLENPMMYHQYGRTLSKLEDLRMRKVFRTEMTTCEWLVGTTGTGKSHRAFEGFSPETHYVYPNDGGWWDGYVQQSTVIINDFRGAIPYDVLLNLIDKWPYSVRRRGREPMPFTSKHIIITSPMTPKEVYHNRDEADDIAQLMRRLDITECLGVKCSVTTKKKVTCMFV